MSSSSNRHVCAYAKWRFWQQTRSGPNRSIVVVVFFFYALSRDKYAFFAIFRSDVNDTRWWIVHDRPCAARYVWRPSWLTWRPPRLRFERSAVPIKRETGQTKNKSDIFGFAILRYDVLVRVPLSLRPTCFSVFLTPFRFLPEQQAPCRTQTRLGFGFDHVSIMWFVKFSGGEKTRAALLIAVSILSDLVFFFVYYFIVSSRPSFDTVCYRRIRDFRRCISTYRPQRVM